MPWQQQAQGIGVVAVQRMTGDERQAAFRRHVHRAQIVGFKQELAVLHIAFQLIQLGGRLQQRQRGDHHLLAAAGDFARQRQPIADLHLAPLGADALAEINNVGAALRRLLIERRDVVFWPVVEYRPQCVFHVSSGYCHLR